MIADLTRVLLTVYYYLRIKTFHLNEVVNRISIWLIQIIVTLLIFSKNEKKLEYCYKALQNVLTKFLYNYQNTVNNFTR